MKILGIVSGGELTETWPSISRTGLSLGVVLVTRRKEKV